MTFVDSDLMQGRRNGHIKLHGAEGFEGMRKAGALTARSSALAAAAPPEPAGFSDGLPDVGLVPADRGRSTPYHSEAASRGRRNKRQFAAGQPLPKARYFQIPFACIPLLLPATPPAPPVTGEVVG